MYIVATFRQTQLAELMVNQLLAAGLPTERLMVIPLTQFVAERHLLDKIRQADGYSSMDIAAILGTICMLLGAIYGNLLRWGAVLWALIGAISGIALGLLVKWCMIKRRPKQVGSPAELVILVHCDPTDKKTVLLTLQQHGALGIGELSI